MLVLLRDLLAHNAFANAALLSAIRQHKAAAQDDELRKMLHHILLANRFWILLILGRPFHAEEESRIPDSLDILVDQYRSTHNLEWEWLTHVQTPDLARLVETPFIPGGSFSIAQALMQVCLHSQGHRAQCAAKLRSIGGAPPATDFILWLKDRPAANWLTPAPDTPSA